MDAPHRTPHVSAFASSAARFALGVAARLGVGASAAERGRYTTPGPARVLQRLPSFTMHTSERRFTIAPRIDVRLASLARRAEGRPTGGVRVHALPHAATPVRHEARTGQEFQRVTRAHARGVVGAESRSNGGFAAPTSVPRVLRRRGPSTPAPEPAPSRTEWGARTPAPMARSTTLSPVEMNRLTDHIVHTIDRRIAAFRERQGRV